jgi:hypothetical protein
MLLTREGVVIWLTIYFIKLELGLEESRNFPLKSLYAIVTELLNYLNINFGRTE